ncbi:MAG: Uma2 family endonuclease [Cyanobacteria bacterium]|nr:Uma2 family endonuclease [Cyanobacteria bacterium CG_2015-16_32_12]NCO77922.1 Uma2 family endonuclease [Cyanobacteria bacterium CG_2015-22_32_23]NCQ05502.1 Uma2 family endonuclease [Cyanobacteria bacterium CG_2015-09_32_10]NCQ41499.1 Uma2 family endonuclease [Cyanobacteria bacterium CG_2015-04_32_10]NCS83926.1 Uma2 family endonuclease [Cyanobacteria bacterium CG_2015-02_32_10]
MVTLISQKQITLEDFLQLPETKPAQEYIDNQISQKPMPQGKHSLIQGEFVTVINSIIKPEKIGLAFPELRCTFGGKSIVPDIVVLTYDRIPRDDNGDIANVVSIAPDWMIEILSPEQSQSKIIKKIVLALEYGCKLAWIIDPKEKIIFAYYPQQVKFFDDDTDVLPVPDFVKALKLTNGEIFSWLKF